MTDATGLPSIRRLSLGDLDRELDTTRTVLARIPDDRLDWRPHEKSWTVGELAAHLANLVGWQVSMLESDEFDLDARGPNRSAPPDRETLLREYDRNVEALRGAVAEADDSELLAPWTLRKGDEVIFDLPRSAALRNAGISHMIHHRGQLTVYLRMMDVPVPPTYGPTADEG